MPNKPTEIHDDLHVEGDLTADGQAHAQDIGSSAGGMPIVHEDLSFSDEQPVIDLVDGRAVRYEVQRLRLNETGDVFMRVRQEGGAGFEDAQAYNYVVDARAPGGDGDASGRDQTEFTVAQGVAGLGSAEWQGFVLKAFSPFLGRQTMFEWRGAYRPGSGIGRVAHLTGAGLYWPREPVEAIQFYTHEGGARAEIREMEVRVFEFREP